MVVVGVGVGVVDGRVVVDLWLVLWLFFFGSRIYYFIVLKTKIDPLLQHVCR